MRARCSLRAWWISNFAVNFPRDFPRFRSNPWRRSSGHDNATTRRRYDTGLARRSHEPTAARLLHRRRSRWFVHTIHTWNNMYVYGVCVCVFLLRTSVWYTTYDVLFIYLYVYAGQNANTKTGLMSVEKRGQRVNLGGRGGGTRAAAAVIAIPSAAVYMC